MRGNRVTFQWHRVMLVSGNGVGRTADDGEVRKGQESIGQACRTIFGMPTADDNNHCCTCWCINGQAQDVLNVPIVMAVGLPWS